MTLSLSNLEKMRLRIDFIALYSFLCKGSGEGHADNFFLVSSGRMHGNGSQVCQWRFGLEIRIRIIEYSGLEGTFTGHLVQPLCNEQGHLQLDQVPQSLTLKVSRDEESTTSLGNLTLKVSRDEESTTSLGNLLQCLTILIAKNFFLMPINCVPIFLIRSPYIFKG